MKCFDAQIRSEGRSIEELEQMAKEGIEAAISVSYYPISHCTKRR